MKVQVLGTGCPKCGQLIANVEAAVAESGVDAEVEKVEDIKQILAFGVMMTPALVLDGEVKSSGKVLNVNQIVEMLRGQ